jgi:hypothetical protein
LLADAPQLVPERVGQLLLAHAEQITQTEGLARLRADVPLPPPPHLASPTQHSFARLYDWFEGLEFKSLLPRLDKLRAARGGGGASS